MIVHTVKIVPPDPHFTPAQDLKPGQVVRVWTSTAGYDAGPKLVIQMEGGLVGTFDLWEKTERLTYWNPSTMGLKRFEVIGTLEVDK